MGTRNVGGDNYQYRMDENWTESDAASRHSAKRYVFNPVPKPKMFQRQVVGDMIKPQARGKEDYLEDTFGLPRGELGRKQQLLLDRVNRVKEYSLHCPEWCYSQLATLSMGSYLLKFYRDKLGDIELKNYSVPPKGTKTNFCQFGDLDNDDGYTRVNKLGWQEVYWNKLILELFYEMKFERVYGNHDGYR